MPAEGGSVRSAESASRKSVQARELAVRAASGTPAGVRSHACVVPVVGSPSGPADHRIASVNPVGLARLANG